MDGTDELTKKKSKKEKDKDSKIEKALKTQNDLVWNIKDELKKECSTNDLKERLIFNKQQVPPGESAILDRVADGMALGLSSPARSAQASWSSGAMLTTVLGMSLPGPSAENEWVTPKEFREISYLKKLKVKKQDRIFPPETSTPLAVPPSSALPPAAVNTSAPADKPLSSMKVLLLGKLSRNKDEVKTEVEKLSKEGGCRA